MPTAAVHGIEIYYELSGSGPNLLFLNGSGATLETTGLLVTPFAQSCSVAAFDQRGLGKTSIPPGPYTMADYAADAIGLLDLLEWDSARVVGISFGGMVAQELAVTVPDRIERLALCCTSPGGSAGASYPLHELERLPPDERAEVGMRVLDTRFTPEWLEQHPDDRALAEMMAARATASKTDEQRRGEAEQLGARKGHDVTDRLGAIHCPTLVASGRYDGIAPVANGAAIVERVPDAEQRIYEGGHAFFIQDPAALPDICAFLAG